MKMDSTGKGSVGDSEIRRTPVQNVVLPSGGDNGTMINEMGVKCDDCSKNKPIRIWRWCTSCERVLCEPCAVQGHTDKEHGSNIVEYYSTAVRRSDEEFGQALASVRMTEEKLREGAKEAEELKKEIISKLEMIKRKMGDKFDGGKDIEATLDEYLNTMLTLKKKPLNAKTWNDRTQAKAGLESLLNTARIKQEETEKYLESVGGVVDEAGNKLNDVLNAARIKQDETEKYSKSVGGAGDEAGNKSNGVFRVEI